MNAHYAAAPNEKKSARSTDCDQQDGNSRHDASSPQRKALCGTARAALRALVLMLAALAVLAPKGTLAAKAKVGASTITFIPSLPA